MEVLLTGWRTRNIRGGLRDMDVDLGNVPPRWTLIQMANGMGKTTTMALLRATLTAQDLAASYVRDLRADDLVETGLFEVRLLIDGKALRLQLELDFRDGSATYWSVRAEARGGGREEGRVLPTELRQLLKPSLTELFIFNGELATEIIQIGKTKASEAIRALYGLDSLDPLQRRVDGIIEAEQRRAASVTSAKEKKGLTQLKNAYDEALEIKGRLDLQQQQAAARIAQSEKERARLERERAARLAEDAEARAQIEDLARRQSEVDTDAADYSSQALDILRRPPHVSPRLLSRLQRLGGKLYDLKLPETISREFFRELSQRAMCVCGRPIGHAERHEIITGADQFLAQDQISIINQMKLALRESAGDPAELSNLIGKLRQKLRERHDLKRDRDRLTSDRIADGDEVLARLEADLRKITDDLAGLSNSLERLTTKDPIRQKALRVTWETNGPLCEAELKTRKFRHETATKTRDFARQGSTLKSLIEATNRRALDILRERVRLSTNVKLAQILKNERIEVSRIGGHLELASDRLGAKAGASEGQKLAIAYAFLTSLLAEAPYRLPFVVDSPAVSLDTAARREVGDLIPDFFGQMILFVISSERAGFGDAFYSRGSDVRYITVISNGVGGIELVEGLDRFKTFHDHEGAPV